MDNQQDQLGATTPNSTVQNSQPPASARKPAAGPTAPSTEATPNAASETTATASTERQGEGQQTNATEAGTVLDTALNSGKKWIEDSGVLNNINQLPQALKDLGNRAAARVGDLTTTQKVVGGAILAVGLGWLATRKGKSSGESESSPYNYGRQRDAGSYGRQRYGYRAPDASTSRNTASGAANHTDSGVPYGNSSSRYGASQSPSSNAGIKSGSGRSSSDSAPTASANTDHGARTPESKFGSSSAHSSGGE